MIDYQGPCLDCNLPGDDDLPEGMTEEQASDLAFEAAVERESDIQDAKEARRGNDF